MRKFATYAVKANEIIDNAIEDKGEVDDEKGSSKEIVEES